MRFASRFAISFLLQKATCQGQVLSYGGTWSSQERREQRMSSRRSSKGTTSTLDVVRVYGRSLLGDGPQGSSLLLVLLILHVLGRIRRGGGDQGGRQARHLGGRAGEGVKTHSLGAPAIWQGVRTVIPRLVHRVLPLDGTELHHRHPPSRVAHPRVALLLLCVTYPWF